MPDSVTSEVAQIARQENHPHSGQNITGQEKKQRPPAVFPMSSRAGRVDKRRCRNLLPGRKLHCGKRQHAVRRERHQQHPGFPVDAPQKFRPPEKIPPVQPFSVQVALIRNLPGFRHHCPFRQVYC